MKNINTYKDLRKRLNLRDESKIKKLLKRQEEYREELADLNNCTRNRRIRIDIELDIIHKELKKLKYY